jgi:hypothetical protein
MAQDLYPAENGRNLEEGELTMTLEIPPLEKVIEMIKNQEIVDGKTISGVMVGKMKMKENG